MNNDQSNQSQQDQTDQGLNPGPDATPTVVPNGAEGKLSIIAIIGLCMAVLAPPFGLIISMYALLDIYRTKKGGRGLAIIGIAMGVLLCFAFFSSILMLSGLER